MRRARREILRAAAVAPVAGLLPGAPAAAAWPERPVRLIVTFPAGSLTDVLTRQVAEGLSRVLGQPVVVDNRAGAQGIVGIRALLGAPADGHTLVIVGVTTGATNVHLVKDLPYHPLRDLTPVGYIGESPYMLVAAPDLPAADTNELLDLARRRPGSVSFSYGSGSAQVAGALLAKLAGVEVLPVPYRGGPEALNDVMAGRVGYTFTDFANGLVQVREGRVRGLAVSTRDRFPLAAELPPVHDAVPSYDLSVWFSLAGPIGLPAPAVERLNGALAQVVLRPDLRERLARQGIGTRVMAAPELRDFWAAEIENWGRVVRLLGLEAQ